jgi:NADH-quinone oxidoreductase subunit E
MQIHENTQHVYEKYPSGQASCLIDMLQDVQEHFGYLPDIEMQKVARHVDIPVSRVYGVATFYNQFRFQPLGKFVIRVCRGTACHVKGSLDILLTLENELGIKAGQTSKDQNFTIETVACIGACSIAPVIAVNEEFHGGLTNKSLVKLLAQYRKKATTEVEHECV